MCVCFVCFSHSMLFFFVVFTNTHRRMCMLAAYVPVRYAHARSHTLLAFRLFASERAH